MTATKASQHTIARLYAAYTRQGIGKPEAVKLIAVSLGLAQEDVRTLVDRNDPVPLEG